MYKIFLLVVLSLILTAQITFSEQKTFSINAGYSFGGEYGSAKISCLSKDPKFFNFGIDIQRITYSKLGETSLIYLSFIHIGSTLFQKQMLFCDWLLGVSAAKTFYTKIETDIVTTIGLGGKLSYFISPTWSIDGKIFGIIYSDGYSFPYYVGPVFKYKKFTVSAGVEGITTVISAPGRAGSSSNIGFMFLLGYNF